MTSYTRPGVFVNQSLTPLTASTSGVTGGAVACFAYPFNIGPTQPTFVTSWQNFTALYGGFSTANGSPLHYAVFQYFNNGGSGCYVYRLPNTDATVASLSVDGISGGTDASTAVLKFSARSPGAWGNGLYVEIVAGSTGADGTATFTLNVYNGGSSANNLVETWPAVSLNPASPRYLLSLLNAANSGSSYVTASVAYTGAYTAGVTDPAVTSPTPLATGADGSTAPAIDTAITTGISGTGWNCPSLNGLSSQVINLNIPAGPASTAGIGGPVAQSVLNNVINWALAQGNVFVVIDAPFGGVPLVASSALAGPVGSPSSGTYGTYLLGTTQVAQEPNAAVYGPWLSIQDPASSSPNATRWAAPGGAILGYWSKNDAQFSVAQTPAGTTATVAAVALEAYFTPNDLSNLETLQVNPVKLVPGSGFCIFGGRTLASGYPNRYINVSRTLMQFSTDFTNITQFAIFQNNDAALWASVSTVLTNYLMTAMQSDMLAGTTPETAFQVTCDDTTTSAAQAQAGIVNATVAVALVSPAEFIIINLSQMTSGATVSVSA